MTQSSIVLTGATGFIGRHVRAALIERGFDVHATSRTGGTSTTTLDLISNTDETLEYLSQAAPDLVLHLAAAGVDGDRERLAPLVAANVLGTAHLLDAAVQIGVPRLIHVSSDLAAEPNDPYGATKHAAELLVEHANMTGAITTLNLRLPVVFGPGEPAQKLIPMLIEATLSGDPVHLRDPQRIRRFLYIDDAVEAIIAAMSDSNCVGTRNVASAASCSVAEINDLVCAVVQNAEIPQAPEPHVPTNALAGWTPQTGLPDALRLTIGAEWTGRQRWSSS